MTPYFLVAYVVNSFGNNIDKSFDVGYGWNAIIFKVPIFVHFIGVPSGHMNGNKLKIIFYF